MQASVILDSGILLLEDVPDLTGPITSIDIVYFAPRIMIYGDGEYLDVAVPDQLGNRLEVRLTGGPSPNSGISFSRSMSYDLLRLQSLYSGRKVPTIDMNYPCTIISFTSGHFRCSAVKSRKFYVISNGLQVSRVAHPESIAHDIVIEFDLGTDGVLSLADNGSFQWSTRLHPNVKRRIDIEILAEDGTATQFYKDKLELDPADEYLLPNQGNPPPMGAP